MLPEYMIQEGCDALDGLANEKGVTANDVDPDQLEMGIKVEMEHTKDKKIAFKIALDHLSEEGNEKYYSNLLNMEKATKEKQKTIELTY